MYFIHFWGQTCKICFVIPTLVIVEKQGDLGWMCLWKWLDSQDQAGCFSWPNIFCCHVIYGSTLWLPFYKFHCPISLRLKPHFKKIQHFFFKFFFNCLFKILLFFNFFFHNFFLRNVFSQLFWRTLLFWTLSIVILNNK